MKKITIYSTRICPYCVRAKNFFNKKNIEYTEIMIDQDPSLIKEMIEKSGRQSVPQIFIGDYHVGGFDDLIEHDMDGKLTRFAQLMDMRENRAMELESGIAAFETKNFAHATKLLSPIAEEGNPDAMYRMAIMLQNGLGCLANEDKAFDLYEKSSRGRTTSCNACAWFYVF